MLRKRRFVFAAVALLGASLSLAACGHHRRHHSKQFSIKEANEKLEIFFDHIDATEDQKQRIRSTAKRLLVKAQAQRASHQQAKALMLRNSLKLAELWNREENSAQITELLSPIVDWFDPSADSPELKKARWLISGT